MAADLRLKHTRHVAEEAWSWVGAAWAVGALAGWWLPREALDWQATLIGSQPWRLLTAAGVHLSPAHLAANLLGAAVVLVFGRLAGCGPAQALAWLAAMPLGHALLLMQPQLERYAGLSGGLHAGVAIASLHLLLAHRGRPQLLGAAVMVGLLLKIALEGPLAAPVRLDPDWGFPVAVLAHATGAWAGAVCGLVAWVTSRRRQNPTIA